MHRLGAASLLAVAVTSCGSVVDQPDVDPALYIRSFCEASCEKNEECVDPLPVAFEDCLETCERLEFGKLDIIHCFELQENLNRCRIDTLPCEEWPIDENSILDDAECRPESVALSNCLE